MKSVSETFKSEFRDVTNKEISFIYKNLKVILPIILLAKFQPIKQRLIILQINRK
jgi:hypothetical protein